MRLQRRACWRRGARDPYPNSSSWVNERVSRRPKVIAGPNAALALSIGNLSGSRSWPGCWSLHLILRDLPLRSAAEVRSAGRPKKAKSPGPVPAQLLRKEPRTIRSSSRCKRPGRKSRALQDLWHSLAPITPIRM
jgi:hypothetical protein